MKPVIRKVKYLGWTAYLPLNQRYQVMYVCPTWEAASEVVRRYYERGAIA
jgi:hypothetical protein